MEPSFSYPDFAAWYETFAADVLTPALHNANRSLRKHIYDALDESQANRIKISEGRVKSAQRLWRKLRLDKYASRLAELSQPHQIPTVIDDLIGTRVTCTNTSDQEMVIDILGQLPVAADLHQLHALALLEGSIKDYTGQPKPSGYRAYHVNLVTTVPIGTRFERTICELQVRTLLQDSWGDLTHEDTYKPGSVVPPIVTQLSRRISDLLATIDDIAQDLRVELEGLAGEPELAEASTHTSTQPSAPSDEEVARRSLVTLYQSLREPISMAAAAYRVRQDAEMDIAADWFGHGSFATFTKTVVPPAQVITATPPGYLLPASIRPSDFHEPEVDETASEFPAAAVAMRRADKGFPLRSTADLTVMYASLATATAKVPRPDTPDVRQRHPCTAEIHMIDEKKILQSKLILMSHH